MGLINNPAQDGLFHKKLAYYTYKKMTEILDGSDWGQIASVRDTNSIRVFRFARNGSPIWIAWNDGRKLRTVRIPIGQGSGGKIRNVRVIEAVPRVSSGKDVHDYRTAFHETRMTVSGSSVEVRLGDTPVYVVPVEQ